tara:strand:+ start:1322 stop:2944 length:1623 start_codon:yes stop_codon:yes gene_type:complete
MLMFVAPIHMLQIYDRVLVSRSDVTLLVLTLLAVGLLVIYGVLEGVRSKILIRVGTKFDELVGQRLFNLVFETAVRQPKLVPGQALRDMDTVRDFISGQAIIALCDAPWVPLFIAVGFFLHPLLGLVSVIGAVIIFILALINELWTRRGLTEANTLTIQAANELGSSLRNAEIVKALGMVGGVKKTWNQNHDGALTKQVSASDRAAAVVASSRFVRMALQVIILAVGGYLAIQDEITPGVMIAASILMGRALAPVEMAVAQWRNFIGVRTALQRLNSLVDSQPESKELMELPAPRGFVSFESVFARPPETGTLVLLNVSIQFEPGSFTALVGPSGCGKSSLVRTLVGVWPAVRGTVRIDGANIDNWSPERLGPHIGYMPQDVELFNGTVAENIARFQMIDSPKVVEAAEKAGAHDLILKLPDGYDTNIGSQGQALSGGQRQMIALARAMYGDPQIIVLDEPNASLDGEGEKKLAGAIMTAKQSGATVVVVSHRPALLSIADNIGVMNHGRVINFGPRDQILNELKAGQPTAPSQPTPANN